MDRSFDERAPGASAHEEYERRHARDQQRLRERLPLAIAVVLATPPIIYLLVRWGGLIVNEQIWPSITDRDDIGALLPSQTLHWLALVLAGLATLRVATVVWGRRQTTEAWRVGAAGERATGRVLEKLPEGWVVLHDLRMPAGRGNIDHLALGPTGVFTIESKHYTDPVVIRRGRATRRGYSLDAVIDQATRQATAVREVLGHPVAPVVCVHGAGVRVEGWFQRPTIAGVRVCSGRRLRQVLTAVKPHLTAEQVAALAASVRARLGSSSASSLPTTGDAPMDRTVPGCVCGAPMVRRARRADGTPFWGCSRYPACRRTQPA